MVGEPVHRAGLQVAGGTEVQGDAVLDGRAITSGAATVEAPWLMRSGRRVSV